MEDPTIVGLVMKACRRGLVVGLLSLLVVPFGWAGDGTAIRYRNTTQSVTYVGSKVCAGCHKKIYKKYYRGIAMGRSMASASQPSELKKVPKPITIYNAKLNRYFEVFQKDSDIYQSQYELDAGKNIVFKTTHKLEYVVGAGTNGFTYVIRRGEHLFEAPLSFYAKLGRWDLSPGYELGDVGFSRPIRAACLWCHNGQPEGVPHGEGLYRQPPFRFGEPAIGCEVCHGPGQLHVKELSTQEKRASLEVDTSIVNPAKLSARLADDICMYCHQGGHDRVLQPGKEYSDFRPGTPLYETVAIFKLPLKEEQREEANLAERLTPVRGSLLTPSWWKNSLMRWSKCYLESNGRLSCLTCHEIHAHSQPVNRVAYYRKKCLSCHTQASCRLPLQERRRQASGRDDCAGCHMPKRPVGGISHSSLTPHRVVRRSGQPLPEIAFEDATPDLPGLVYLNKPSEGTGRTLSPLAKLAAYGQIMKKEPRLRQNYLEILEELSEATPDHPLVLAALGRKALFEKNPQAVEYLSRALENGSEVPTTYQDLGEALARAGEVEAAVRIFERGVSRWPYSVALRKFLILRYITLKQYPRAHEAMKKYVELFPHDSFMRGLLQKAETAQTARRLLGNPLP